MKKIFYYNSLTKNMNKKKLLIGINVDEFLKKSIQKNIKYYKDLPVRWHLVDSYHIPLISLGWVSEDIIAELIESLNDFAKEMKEGYVEFKKIAFVENKSGSKNIRVVGNSSEYMRELYIDIMDFLDIRHGEIGEFSPVINLGHVRANAWNDLNIKPVIKKDFSVICDITTFTLFEDSKKIDSLETFDLT